LPSANGKAPSHHCEGASKSIQIKSRSRIRNGPDKDLSLSVYRQRNVHIHTRWISGRVVYARGYQNAGAIDWLERHNEIDYLVEVLGLDSDDLIRSTVKWQQDGNP
jgi:hypothetical protein